MNNNDDDINDNNNSLKNSVITTSSSTTIQTSSKPKQHQSPNNKQLKKEYTLEYDTTSTTTTSHELDLELSQEDELYHDNYFMKMKIDNDIDDNDDSISLESQDLEYSTSTHDLEYSTSTITTSQSHIKLELNNNSSIYQDDNNTIFGSGTIATDDYTNVEKNIRKEQNNHQDQHQQPFWNEFDINSTIIDPTKTVVHNFFFTEGNSPRNEPPLSNEQEQHPDDHHLDNNINNNKLGMSKEEYEKAQSFWKSYDDIVIICIMSQIGVLFRIFSSAILDSKSTFHEGSALYTTLPLNVISCIMLGILCNGVEAIKYVKREDGEFRNVQIEGLERRIRRCNDSLVLFMSKREEGDVMQHYEDYYNHHNMPRKGNDDDDGHNRSVLEQSIDFDYTGSLIGDAISLTDATGEASQSHDRNNVHAETPIATPMMESSTSSSPIRSRYGRRPTRLVSVNRGISSQSAVTIDPSIDIDCSPTFSNKALPSVQEEDIILQQQSEDSNTQDKNDNPPLTLHMISSAFNINTTSTAMSSDLMLGLRVGFCGALSSFASWNSEMVQLLRQGYFGQAFMGYLIGVALPILGYWFGIQIALFIFIVRCRREIRKAERRGGYGIRPPTGDSYDESDDSEEENISSSPAKSPSSSPNKSKQKKKKLNYKPSIRAFATAIFIIAIITEFTCILVLTKPSSIQFALQLLFSPLGVILRWKLNKFNSLFINFPLGTFLANMLSCLLSGSVGFFLAGNPNPEERIVLQSLISGLGGTLSTLSLFIVQILNGIDAIILRWDGLAYCAVTIFWGMVIGLVTEQSKDWADNL